jgi:hypothetical protein
MLAGLVVAGRRALLALALTGAGAALAAGCAAPPPVRTHPVARTSAPASPSTSPSATATASPTAPAPDALPGIYLGSMAGPWVGLKVRPPVLYLGADWTITKLRWADWTRRHADGRGYEVGCAGADGPCTRSWDTITLSRVRVHGGARYFALMRLDPRLGRERWMHMDGFGVWSYRR